MDVDKLKAILAALQGTEVSSLDWTDGQERLRLRVGHPPAAVHAVAAAAPAAPAPAAPPPAAPAPAAAAPAPAPKAAPRPGLQVTSPFVGTFYRSSSPEAAPFVDVGSLVQKGQVLCIVEAMKLMNEIEAEQAGRVAEVLVPNGAPVEYGEALFRLEPV